MAEVSQLANLCYDNTKLNKTSVLHPDIYFTIQNRAGEKINLNSREFDWLMSWHYTPHVGICDNIGCVQKSPSNKTEFLIFKPNWTGGKSGKLLITLNEFSVLQTVHQDMNRMAKKACIMLKKCDVLPQATTWTLSDFTYFIYDLYMCILKHCYNNGKENSTSNDCYATAISNLMNESNIVYEILQENGIFADSTVASIPKDFLHNNLLDYALNCVLYYYVPSYVKTFIEAYTSPTFVNFQATCAAL